MKRWWLWGIGAVIAGLLVYRVAAGPGSLEKLADGLDASGEVVSSWTHEQADAARKRAGID